MKSPNPMDLFRTRDKANAGIKLPLMDPATGKDTEHWLTILSVDSDAYQQANTKAMRQSSVIQAMETEEAKAAAINSNSLDIIVALVQGWSFDTPCTPENVRQFLIDAPQIRGAINLMATDRALFMNSNSQDSQPGSDQSAS